MRPGRDNIAAPDLPHDLEWIGTAPESMPALTAGGPALVHFLDFAQLNSARTLPYLERWAQRYAEMGLGVIGVQAPRFPFGAEREAVAAGLDRLGVSFPVAIDRGQELWGAYGCEGWPSLFLWSLGGALTWFQFGEGEYRATEEAIQDELREIDALRQLPEPLAPLRPTDAPGVEVMPPSPEIFPSDSWEQPWVAGEEADELEIEYAAGAAWLTAEGEGEVAVAVDGSVTAPVAVTDAGLYPLASHPRHELHRVALRPDPGLRIWSVSFEPGLP